MRPYKRVIGLPVKLQPYKEFKGYLQNPISGDLLSPQVCIPFLAGNAEHGPDHHLKAPEQDAQIKGLFQKF